MCGILSDGVNATSPMLDSRAWMDVHRADPASSLPPS